MRIVPHPSRTRKGLAPNSIFYAVKEKMLASGEYSLYECEHFPDNRDFMQIFKSVFSGALRQWDENWKNFDPEKTTLEEYMNETFGPLLSKPENPEGSAPEENKE